MIILQAGQTIPDPNIFCDPQHFGGNFTVWATQRTVFYPNFFCDPQQFGGFIVIKRKKHGDHEKTKCLLMFTHDHKCIRMISSEQSVYL